MRKSKGNVINPDDIVNEFGADTLRLYEMFMGDYKEDVPWSTESLKGCKRFIDKVIRLKDTLNDNEGFTKDLEKIQNQTIKKVTYDLDNMAYNTAVSSLMILTNAYQDAKSLNLIRLYYRPYYLNHKLLLTLLNPIAPHITEELNESIGFSPIVNSTWPVYDEDKTKDTTVTIAVSVNGKVRGKLEVDVDTPSDILQEKAFTLPNVQNFTNGKEHSR